MKRIELSPEDEYTHVPSSEDPLWREGYHFNGYDPLNEVGITISMGIRPNIGVKNDFVMVHVKDVFLFLDRRKFEREGPHLESLEMEPLVPFERWRIQMKDTFRKSEEGNFLNISETVEFHLYFESEIPPYGHSVDKWVIDRGERYEQPGFLRGSIEIGENRINFEGRGIRDHSWGVRDLSKWENWYGMMGRFESGEALTFVYIMSGDRKFFDGWRRINTYQKIVNAWIDPAPSSDFPKEYRIHVETSEEKLEMNSQIISYITIPVGKKSKMAEILVKIERDEIHGYGFLWFGRPD